MKVPEPRRLRSGNYCVRLRLGGEEISITRPTAREAKQEAQLIKAEYCADKRIKSKIDLTPSQCIDQYLAGRQNTLSPSTIRFYRTIQKHRFAETMSVPVSSVKDWQTIVDAEAAKCSVKTLRNAYSALRTAIKAVTGTDIPAVRYGVPVPHERPFLTAAEIPAFVKEVSPTKYAVPLLLALSSMRISEIQALDWKDIPEKPKFIKVRGAVVFDENNHYTKKKENKNRSSARNVPVLIPELASALERDRKPSGPVMPCTQNNLRVACHNLCKRAGVTEVTPHGLRHSFASLAYHLGMPEKIAMEIGGWSDATTMRKIYTHVAQSDITRYENAIGDFFKNGDKNGDGTPKAAK